MQKVTSICVAILFWEKLANISSKKKSPNNKKNNSILIDLAVTFLQTHLKKVPGKTPTNFSHSLLDNLAIPKMN